MYLPQQNSGGQMQGEIVKRQLDKLKAAKRANLFVIIEPAGRIAVMTGALNQGMFVPEKPVNILQQAGCPENQGQYCGKDNSKG